MNVNFKVYWNNPIEMSTEAGTQQLTFEVPLGVIIPNPSGGTASYPSLTGNADKVLPQPESPNRITVFLYLALRLRWFSNLRKVISFAAFDIAHLLSFLIFNSSS